MALLARKIYQGRKIHFLLAFMNAFHGRHGELIELRNAILGNLLFRMHYPPWIKACEKSAAVESAS